MLLFSFSYQTSVLDINVGNTEFLPSTFPACFIGSYRWFFNINCVNVELNYIPLKKLKLILEL